VKSTAYVSDTQCQWSINLLLSLAIGKEKVKNYQMYK